MEEEEKVVLVCLVCQDFNVVMDEAVEIEGAEETLHLRDFRDERGC